MIQDFIVMNINRRYNRILFLSFDTVGCPKGTIRKGKECVLHKPREYRFQPYFNFAALNKTVNSSYIEIVYFCKIATVLINRFDVALLTPS
jgi:hypothetical protein